MIKALEIELKNRNSEIAESIETIYFGGGTPSVLNESELMNIMEVIHQKYKVTPDAELTLECNPDDIDKSKLEVYKRAGVNRLSIGVQSFRDDDLVLFNRGHNAAQAESAIKASQDIGLTNITIDLIYGIPGLDMEAWNQNLDKFILLNLPHLSAYTLTVEPKTALQHQVKTQELAMPNDEAVINQFKALRTQMMQTGLDHYEISNFGKPNFHSKHNSNYWKGIPYLGIGPSAHSYDGKKRRWNVANNIQYIKAIQSGNPYSESEHIDEKTEYNEYILTRLRTKWGLELQRIKDRFNPIIVAHFETELDKLKKTSYLQIENNSITLTEEGMTKADGLAAEFFYL